MIIILYDSHFFNSTGANIEQARKNIESAMETRRRSLEVAKARRDQAAEKYIKIRDEINLKKKAGSWMEKASYELETLHKIHGKIPHIHFCHK